MTACLRLLRRHAFYFRHLSYCTRWVEKKLPISFWFCPVPRRPNLATDFSRSGSVQSSNSPDVHRLTVSHVLGGITDDRSPSACCPSRRTQYFVRMWSPLPAPLVVIALKLTRSLPTVGLPTVQYTHRAGGLTPFKVIQSKGRGRIEGWFIYIASLSQVTTPNFFPY